MKKFFTGLSYNRAGWRYFSSHRELWKYAVLPAVLNLFAVSVLAFFFVRHAEAAFFYLTRPLEGLVVADPAGFLQNVLAFLAWVARALITALLFFVGLVLTAACLYVFGLILSGPFYEMLSERVLVLTGQRADQPFRLKAFLGDFWHALKTECVKAAFFLSVSFALFLFGWIPILGLVFSALQLVFSAWFFAFGICTYPLVLERSSWAGLFRWGRQNAGELVGFGLPALIPFVGAIIGPVQVVGGTLFYGDRKAAR